MFIIVHVHCALHCGTSANNFRITNDPDSHFLHIEPFFLLQASPNDMMAIKYIFQSDILS